MRPCRKLTFVLIGCALTALGASRRDANVSKIDALFQEYDRPGVPGASVIVIRDGKAVYKRAYGFANVEQKVPDRTKTNYRLASVTKQFTAMAIMILAERKRLSLDQRLTDFFPDFPEYGKAITVRHLLNHTSGLAAYETIIENQTPRLYSETSQIKDRDVLELLKRQSAAYFPPGSQFRYSNTGYAVLALIVEAVSHDSFAQFLKKNIFTPLHMKNTLAYEAGISTVPNRAYGYTKREGGFERTDQSATSAVLGDGGIYSSVEDLRQWDRALYGSRLVSSDMLKLAFTPAVLTNGKTTEYGFGWEIGTYRGLKTLRHGGVTMGFRTWIMRFPAQRFTVIVLMNRNDATPGEIANRIADLYLPE